MRIPTDDVRRLQLYRDVREQCLYTREDRLTRYAQNRRMFFYGSESDTPSRSNKIYSHLDTVSSFLYAAETTRFNVLLGQRATSADYPKKEPFGERINEEWHATNADFVMSQAVLWSLVYDSTIVKLIRRGGTLHPWVIDPACFGVYRDDVSMLDRQEAFIHVYYTTYADLERRLVLHPRRAEILQAASCTYQKRDSSEEMPAGIGQLLTMVQTETNLVGQANIPLTTMNDYRAQMRTPLIEMGELWIWDDGIDDYRVVTMASDVACVYDRPNLFMPRNPLTKGWEPEHGFVQICPNPVYDYFWGASELERLLELQRERNDLKANIKRLQDKQVDPPSAWTGMGLNEDKLAGFNDPGANVNVGGDGMAKRESYVPQIPADVYTSLHENAAEFDETSGLTNVLAGRGESGVRSSGHASKLATLGSARPKKRALVVEDSLEKIATLYGKTLYLDDDETLHDEEGQPFVIAQMTPHFNVEVDGHSNSPVFMENQRETGLVLFKAKAITRKRLIQMMAPPMQRDLIRDLQTKIIPGEEAQAAAHREALARGEAAKGGGKGNLRSVS